MEYANDKERARYKVKCAVVFKNNKRQFSISHTLFLRRKSSVQSKFLRFPNLRIGLYCTELQLGESFRRTYEQCSQSQ